MFHGRQSDRIFRNSRRDCQYGFLCIIWCVRVAPITPCPTTTWSRALKLKLKKSKRVKLRTRIMEFSRDQFTYSFRVEFKLKLQTMPFILIREWTGTHKHKVERNEHCGGLLWTRTTHPCEFPHAQLGCYNFWAELGSAARNEWNPNEWWRRSIIDSRIKYL